MPSAFSLSDRALTAIWPVETSIKSESMDPAAEALCDVVAFVDVK